MKKLYEGPVDSHGSHLYPGGVPYGSELAWNPWVVTPANVQSFANRFGDNYLKFLAFPIGQPAPSLEDGHFTVENFNRLRAMAPVYDSTNSDLTAFRQRGGKLIIWHGWADQAIPPLGPPAHCDAVVDRARSLQAAQQFARMFMLPTLYLCAGAYGPGAALSFDFINPVTHWVEQGTAPDQIILKHADQNGNVVRTRPVFAYPTQAKYNGHGSIDDADNFSGVLPKPLPDDDVKWVGNDLFSVSGEDRFDK